MLARSDSTQDIADDQISAGELLVTYNINPIISNILNYIFDCSKGNDKNTSKRMPAFINSQLENSEFVAVPHILLTYNDKEDAKAAHNCLINRVKRFVNDQGLNAAQKKAVASNLIKIKNKSVRVNPEKLRNLCELTNPILLEIYSQYFARNATTEHQAPASQTSYIIERPSITEATSIEPLDQAQTTEQPQYNEAYEIIKTIIDHWYDFIKDNNPVMRIELDDMAYHQVSYADREAYVIDIELIKIILESFNYSDEDINQLMKVDDENLHLNINIRKFEEFCRLIADNLSASDGFRINLLSYYQAIPACDLPLLNFSFDLNSDLTKSTVDITDALLAISNCDVICNDSTADLEKPRKRPRELDEVEMIAAPVAKKAKLSETGFGIFTPSNSQATDHDSEKSAYAAKSGINISYLIN
jgi:hypothetical protein